MSLSTLPGKSISTAISAGAALAVTSGIIDIGGQTTRVDTGKEYYPYTKKKRANTEWVFSSSCWLKARIWKRSKPFPQTSCFLCICAGVDYVLWLISSFPCLSSANEDSNKHALAINLACWKFRVCFHYYLKMLRHLNRKNGYGWC